MKGTMTSRERNIQRMSVPQLEKARDTLVRRITTRKGSTAALRDMRQVLELVTTELLHRIEG